MKKQKILFVNYSLDVGGIETLVLEICKRLDKDSFEPSVCAFVKNGKLQKEFEESGITVHLLEKDAGISFALPQRIYRLLKEQSIDIVHTQNPASWLYCILPARFAGVPLIHTVHTAADYYGRHVRRWIILEHLLSRFTKRIVTVAGSLATFMKEREKVPGHKISVIYNGIHAEKYDKMIDVQKKKAELSLKDTDFVIGNVARFYPNKNHELLVRSFKEVVNRMPHAKLLLAGEGPLKEHIQSLVQQMQLSGSVSLLGNRRDIPELLQVFDLFVLPSKREGFPIGLLEAMAAGLPVVASDVDGNGELVVNGSTGILIPSGDAKALTGTIISMAENKQRAREMGIKGKQRILEHFTFNKMMENYENLYRSVGGSTNTAYSEAEA